MAEDEAFAAFCDDAEGFRARYANSPLRRDPRFAIRCGASGLADYTTFAWFACRRDPRVVLAFVPTVVTVLCDHCPAAELALAACALNPKAWVCVPPPHRDDEDFALAALAANPHVVIYLPLRWQRNRGFMLRAVQLHGTAVWYLGFPFGTDPVFSPWFRLTRPQRRWRRVRDRARLRHCAFWWWEASQRPKYHAEGAGTLVGSEALRARDALWASGGPWA